MLPLFTTSKRSKVFQKNESNVISKDTDPTVTIHRSVYVRLHYNISLSLSSARTTGWRNQATMETHSRTIRRTFSQNLACCGLHFICQWLFIPPLKITVLLLSIGSGAFRRTQRRRQPRGCFRRTTCHSSHSHRQRFCWCLASQWSNLSYTHIYTLAPRLGTKCWERYWGTQRIRARNRQSRATE